MSEMFSVKTFLKIHYRSRPRNRNILRYIPTLKVFYNNIYSQFVPTVA